MKKTTPTTPPTPTTTTQTARKPAPQHFAPFAPLALCLSLALCANAAPAQQTAPAPAPLTQEQRLAKLESAVNALQQENQQLRAQTPASTAATAASKLNLFPGLTSLTFAGDIRVRYEYKQATAADPAPDPKAGDHFDMNRYRYRLRLGVTGKLTGGWFFGARLESSNNNRSTNVTMGSYSAGNGFTGGKATANTIYIGQANVGWASQDFTFTAGRMANPFIYSQFFTWSDDLNVEGLAQQWKHDYGAFTLLANLAQLVYASNGGVVNALGARGVPNTFLFGAQLGARVKLASGRMSLQAAPAYYGYSNDASNIPNMASLNPANTPPGNPNSANLHTTGLRILDIPLELALPPIPLPDANLPAKIFGSLAINLDARARARAAGFPGKKNQNTAWQLGAALGQTKNKNDWELRAFYQSTAAYAIDPNLLDLSQFDARTNMKGITAAAAYALTNSVTLKLTYFNGQRKDAALPTYGYSDIPTANLGKCNTLQADLSLKF